MFLWLVEQRYRERERASERERKRKSTRDPNCGKVGGRAVANLFHSNSLAVPLDRDSESVTVNTERNCHAGSAAAAIIFQVQNF